MFDVVVTRSLLHRFAKQPRDYLRSQQKDEKEEDCEYGDGEVGIEFSGGRYGGGFDNAADTPSRVCDVNVSAGTFDDSLGILVPKLSVRQGYC